MGAMSWMSRGPATRGGWESNLGLVLPCVHPQYMLSCLEKGHVAFSWSFLLMFPGMLEDRLLWTLYLFQRNILSIGDY